MPVMWSPCSIRSNGPSTGLALASAGKSTRVAGDLGINDATVRQTLHERGILTIGIPQTVAPIDPKPTAEAIRSILTDAGLTQKRTPARADRLCLWL